jgi:hypothetical protein
MLWVYILFRDFFCSVSDLKKESIKAFFVHNLYKVELPRIS